MTGKATAVLRGKITRKIKEHNIQVEKSQLLIETIAKLTKVSKVLGITEDGETQYTNKWRDPTKFDYDVLVVDELSMVPSYVRAWWSYAPCLVIGLGDYCQLPEVLGTDVRDEIERLGAELNLPQIKLTRNYGVRVLKEHNDLQLTKVLRSDNDIASLCSDLRDFNIGRSRMVRIMQQWAAKSDDISYSTDMADIEIGTDWQIIGYTNEMCRAINNRLCIGGEYPNRRDKVLLFDNMPLIGKYNGDILIFEDLIAKVAKLRSTNKKVYVCFKWQGKMPKRDSKYGIERQSYEAFVAFKQEYRRIQTRRLNQIIPELRNYIKDNPEQTQEINGLINQIIRIRSKEVDTLKAFTTIMYWLEENNFELMQYLMQRLEKLPQMYMLNLDYGYAITTHKSQGSEYEKVCYILERFDKPLIYTGLSRAKKKLKIIDLTAGKLGG